jgi:hypothetical protein
MGIKTTQNFTLISNLLRKMRSICLQKAYRQNKCKDTTIRTQTPARTRYVKLSWTCFLSFQN